VAGQQTKLEPLRLNLLYGTVH